MPIPVRARGHTLRERTAIPRGDAATCGIAGDSRGSRRCVATTETTLWRPSNRTHIKTRPASKRGPCERPPIGYACPRENRRPTTQPIPFSRPPPRSRALGEDGVVYHFRRALSTAQKFVSFLGSKDNCHSSDRCLFRTHFKTESTPRRTRVPKSCQIAGYGTQLIFSPLRVVNDSPPLTCGSAF